MNKRFNIGLMVLAMMLCIILCLVFIIPTEEKIKVAELGIKTFENILDENILKK